LAVVTVNISTKQNDQVVPFLKDNRYTFPAFKANLEIMQAYEVGGVPSEFVIDPKGRLVAKIRLSSDEREQQFGKLVESLVGS
jgi:hypothetical protein